MSAFELIAFCAKPRMDSRWAWEANRTLHYPSSPATLYSYQFLPTNPAMDSRAWDANHQGQGLIDPQSGERACNSAYACRDGKMLVVTQICGRVAKAAVQSALTFKLSSSLASYSLAKGFGPFLQALEKGRVLFLVTTSTSPSLLAYAELHALSLLGGSISQQKPLQRLTII